jgi:hypothetical protein
MEDHQKEILLDQFGKTGEFLKKKSKRMTIAAVQEESVQLNAERQHLFSDIEQFYCQCEATIRRFKAAEHALVEHAFHALASEIAAQVSTMQSTLENPSNSEELEEVLQQWEKREQTMKKQLKLLQKLLNGASPSNALE